MTERAQFPILGSRGATIDLQLVKDHGKQAQANHYQSVTRLAQRGGLSWSELHAVLHNREWQKMDENTAIIECRAIEARYLAVAATPSGDEIERLRAENAKLRRMVIPDWYYSDGYDSDRCHDSPDEVLEYLDLGEGHHVVQIDCATRLPSIWLAVHVRTKEEMDALGTDDREAFTEHASEEDARQALKGGAA